MPPRSANLFVCLLFFFMRDRGWRDGSAIKSTDCSYSHLWLDSQHLHGSGSQPFLTPVPGALTSSSGLHRCCIQVVHRQASGKTPIHIKFFKKAKKKRGSVIRGQEKERDGVSIRKHAQQNARTCCPRVLSVTWVWCWVQHAGPG